MDGSSRSGFPSQSPFVSEGVRPAEERRRAHEFVTQDTRSHILQAIQGHPTHLPSVREFEYLLPADYEEITAELDRLAATYIVTDYRYTGREMGRERPSVFWGLTEYGVELLDSFDYFRYVPILEALQASVERSEELERHLRAPRPSLPERIAEAFRGGSFDEEALESAERDALGVWNGG